MLQTVEIFYSFQCPYSYLAVDRLSQLDDKFDVQVLWQPFSSRAASRTAHSGTTISPDRSSYIRLDAARLAERAGLPIKMDEDWPENEFDPEKSIRAAVVASDLELIMEYNIKMFHRWWGEGLDPNSQGFFVELCKDLDVDPNEFSGRINSADTRKRIVGVYKRGRKLQVFDTPTVIIGEERFVGVDRISTVEEKLREMGLAK